MTFMKILVLMRHSNAETYAPVDSERPLSEEGKQNAHKAAERLEELGIIPDVVLTSPLARASQTADIVVSKIGGKLQLADELSGRLHAQGTAQFLAAQTKDVETVLAIGHNPNISLAAQVLVKTEFGFAPAEFAILNMDNPHRPELIHTEELA